jgi:hypothetical protein
MLGNFLSLGGQNVWNSTYTEKGLVPTIDYTKQDDSYFRSSPSPIKQFAIASFITKELIEIAPTVKYITKDILHIPYSLPIFIDNNYFKITAHIITCNVGILTAIYSGKILSYEYLTKQKLEIFQNTENKSINNSIEFIKKCGFDILSQTTLGTMGGIISGTPAVYDVIISASISGMQCYNLYNQEQNHQTHYAVIPYIMDLVTLYSVTKQMDFDLSNQVGQMIAVKQVSLALNAVALTDYLTKLFLTNLADVCCDYSNNIVGSVYSYMNWE